MYCVIRINVILLNVIINIVDILIDFIFICHSDWSLLTGFIFIGAFILIYVCVNGIIRLNLTIKILQNVLFLRSSAHCPSADCHSGECFSS
jgi:hypothetical protein